jgi:putative oxidoreductase
MNYYSNKTKTSADIGLLILRAGTGIMFMMHGLPKIFGGPEQWKIIGRAMGHIGIDIYPTFWGFMAGFAEFVGGFLLLTGFLFIPACILLFITMLIASIQHFYLGEGLSGASHALESAILFLSLLLIGPGKYSLKEYFLGRKRRW